MVCAFVYAACKYHGSFSMANMSKKGDEINRFVLENNGKSVSECLS